MNEKGRTGRMVVGVDGSVGSRRALEWAADEARLRGASLHVIYAWHMPALGATLDPEELEAAAEKAAERIFERELAEVDTTGIEVDQRLEERHPVDALLVETEEADLLVVGTRGHGGFAGLLLGSVSQQVSHHARCPVVIVPPPKK